MISSYLITLSSHDLPSVRCIAKFLHEAPSGLLSCESNHEEFGLQVSISWTGAPSNNPVVPNFQAQEFSWAINTTRKERLFSKQLLILAEASPLHSATQSAL